MIPLAVEEVEALRLGDIEAAPWADVITGVEIDSRRIREGDLFVAVGAGADYRRHAVARGAAATLVPDDAHAALAALAGAVRSRSLARVVGITGSAGKTSTKDILAALCRPHARTVAAEASYNNELGVPLTLCRLEADTEVCVLELGMRGLGQIDALCSFARPEIAVITAIGPVHLELVGTVERVAEAKAEVLHWVATGVVPADRRLDPYVPAGLHIRRFSPADVLSFADRHAVLRVGERVVELDVNFSARHQAVNAVAALHAYDALALPLDRAQEGAAEIEFSPWRGEEVSLAGGGTLVNDAYNANPLSMRAALEYLVERADGRRTVAILGDMAELGAEAARYHREVGELAARLGVAVLLAVGPLARDYVEAAAGIPVIRWTATVPEAIDRARELVRDDDCVLVKASRSVGLEAVADALAPVSA